MIHGADVSEFQDVNWSAYDSDFAVVRVHNGTRTDYKWNRQRVDGFRARCKVRGYYGYVVANRDAAAQGTEFASTFKSVAGHALPGEFFIADLEEGSGYQTGRAEAWCNAVDKALGVKSWVYSGESFRSEHLQGEARHFWEAAYQNTEPHDHHVLWQHTDHANHAGVSGPVDCSVFDGNLDQLLNIVNGGKNVALTPADISAISNAVYDKIHEDFVTELRGTQDGTHPVNLTTIEAKLDKIVTKVGA